MNQYQSENTIDLAKTLLYVQRTVQPVAKDAENLFTKSWYASLNSVLDACCDALKLQLRHACRGAAHLWNL